MGEARDRRPLIAAGTLIGVGMGGFFDGILFHQLLQLHGMLTARYPKIGVPPATALVNVEINMVWDGLFHVICWGTTALGIALLWRVARRRDVFLGTATLVGAIALGAGLFNLVEGTIDHEILGIHHVVEAGPHLPWDLAFLASGAVLIAAGWATIRADRAAASAPAA